MRGAGFATVLLVCSAIPVSARDGWFRSLDEAEAAARRSGKPIFLVFRCER
jgi:hypothetical protein